MSRFFVLQAQLFALQLLIHPIPLSRRLCHREVLSPATQQAARSKADQLQQNLHLDALECCRQEYKIEMPQRSITRKNTKNINDSQKRLCFYKGKTDP